MNIQDILSAKNACLEAREWVNSQSAKDAWQSCHRGEWMLWILGKLGYDRKRLVCAACQCGRLSLRYAKSPTVEQCYLVTEAWTRVEKTIEEVASARAAAAAAADAYAADAAAAYAAADADAYAYAAAAYAAAAAAAAAADAYADATAAYAADAYADATAAYAADAYVAARSSIRKQQAEIVRSLVSWEEVEALLKEAN